MAIKRGVKRFDLGEIRESSRTPQGFLKVPGFATRVGVFPYIDGDGKVRRELRHPDDVFDPESLETLKYAPVTIEHPPEMITPENVAEYRVGHTTERVERVADKVDTDLIIEDKEGIEAVESEGVRELSCGYAADIVEESGDWNGAPYDFRQVNIRYNHLAMVKKGRAGPEVRMRLDSADAIMQDPFTQMAKNTVAAGKGKQVPAGEFSQESSVNDDEATNAIGDPADKKIVIAGQEVTLPADIADTVQDFIDRFDEMRAKLFQLEDQQMAKRKDNQDADISQKGVSPQVKVEQETPDGRSAGGKTGAKPGTITGPVGKADDEEEEKKDLEGEEMSSKSDEDEDKKDDDDDDKKDGEEEEKKDYESASGTGAGGAASSPIDRMKKDLEEIRKGYKDAPEEVKQKMDALEGKLDAFAAESFGKNEKRGDSKKTRLDSELDKKIRLRVKLERRAEKLVPSEVSKRFDSMTDDQIRAAVIKHRNPRADLDGKSSVYLQARFDSMTEAFEEEEGSEIRRDAGRRMLGLGAEGEDRMDGEEIDPNAARLRMIKTSREDYKSDLSFKKK